MDKPEALRLADELDLYLYHVPAHPLCTDAAAELRRLHAENASLSAALAASCDEARDQMWESGGVAGCSRALSAEFQRDALLEALVSFTKSDYIKRQHPRRYAAAIAAIALAEGHVKAVEGEKT